jgi:prepilin-type processing-associated H-X9-DG protein
MQSGAFKGDYAASSGDSLRTDGTSWYPAGSPSAVNGDYSAVDGYRSGQASKNPVDFCSAPGSIADIGKARLCQNGVIFVNSETTIASISDGTSNTYLIGEKFINPDQYNGGTSTSDSNLSLMTNQAAYCGYEWDNQRRAWNPRLEQEATQEDYQPRQDTIGINFEAHMFGSAHPSGFHMAYCDGSAQTVTYDVDPYVHSYSASRNDGELP